MTTTAHAIELTNFSHGVLNKMVDAFPADKALFQPFPSANHLVWTLGHLALTYGWLAELIDANAKPQIPDTYNGLFGGKSKPSADAKRYPSLAEVRKVYDSAFGSFVAAAKTLTDKTAGLPTTSDTGGFATSRLDAVYKGAWHDGWHLGQVADLRRALGLPSVM